MGNRKIDRTVTPAGTRADMTRATEGIGVRAAVITPILAGLVTSIADFAAGIVDRPRVAAGIGTVKLAPIMAQLALVLAHLTVGLRRGDHRDQGRGERGSENKLTYGQTSLSVSSMTDMTPCYRSLSGDLQPERHRNEFVIFDSS